MRGHEEEATVHADDAVTAVGTDGSEFVIPPVADLASRRGIITIDLEVLDVEIVIEVRFCIHALRAASESRVSR